VLTGKAQTEGRSSPGPRRGPRSASSAAMSGLKSVSEVCRLEVSAQLGAAVGPGPKIPPASIELAPSHATRLVSHQGVGLAGHAVAQPVASGDGQDGSSQPETEPGERFGVRLFHLAATQELTQSQRPTSPSGTCGGTSSRMGFNRCGGDLHQNDARESATMRACGGFVHEGRGTFRG